MAKRIAMFNHKGGVGKTLTAYHVGWTLAEQGHQVLLVDGDSQVNLTAIALGTERFDTFYEDEATKQFNIKSGVAPVFEGQPRAIAAFECPKALGNERLFVLPGHLDLQAYEAQLSLAQETGGSLSVLRTRSYWSVLQKHTPITRHSPRSSCLMVFRFQVHWN